MFRSRSRSRTRRHRRVPAASTDTARGIDNFVEAVLSGQPVPDDLRRLWLIETVRVPDAEQFIDPFQAMGLRLLRPEESRRLRDEGLAHWLDACCVLPHQADDSMAVEAMNEAINQVACMATFAVMRGRGNLIGYWQGPEVTPLAQSPIVELNTCGIFSLLPGRDLTEALLGLHAGGDASRFAAMAEWFARHDVLITAHRPDELLTPPCSTRPEMLKTGFYNRQRVAAGLLPV
ncbi:MAG: hypothetical protein Q4D91_10750 [Lautropia sp.]|nr:hypothetical protein [Lautropia sp.]